MSDWQLCVSTNQSPGIRASDQSESGLSRSLSLHLSPFQIWPGPLCSANLAIHFRVKKCTARTKKKFIVSNSIKVCELKSENDKAESGQLEWNIRYFRPAIIAYYPYQHTQAVSLICYILSASHSGN